LCPNSRIASPSPKHFNCHGQLQTGIEKDLLDIKLFEDFTS
jgi:hypothetical protein